MEPLSLTTLRERYLAFFESKGHLRLPSFPLVPQGDASLLLINAGMAPLKPYFTGEKVPPRKRVTTCQKCVRTLDIDNVGKTARHGTFFEMLGNFSFGDYFKNEAIPWAWEFLTKDLEIPETLLYPSVYTEDDEAYAIWRGLGVPENHIVRLGKDDNFWEIGSGPCGPCSEIYFDRGEKYGCGKPTCGPGCDCDRFIEIWNIVFTQFDGDGNGNYTRLAHPNIDTGMGLERLACVMQGVGNLFEVDTIRNIMLKVCDMAGKEYRGSEDKDDVSLRVITDHIRTATFLISDGVIPSNEGRGYILRRVLRRAARHGKLLGIKKSFLSELCETVINENMKAYPELGERREYIAKTIKIEEDRFEQTLDAGLGILEKMIKQTLADKKDKLSGDDLFKLYDTFGFPLDLTKDIALEKGLGIDDKAFSSLMLDQKKRAREARAALGDFSWAGESLNLIDKSRPTVFCGYTELSTDSEIITIISEGESISRLGNGSALILLDKTPFYAECGGQVGDTGIIKTSSGEFKVTDTKKTAEGQYLHYGEMLSGEIALGKCVASVDEGRRAAIARNHSSVHLLQAALRKVLGSHVEQAGSYVDEHRARFDFSHPQALTSDEITRVENIVNDAILKGMDIITEEKPIAEAKKDGAMALFGEKYGDIVRVVKMGDFSAELCGGTHLANTARVGLFRILNESSVAAGVRRIEAITGLNSLEAVRNDETLIAELQSEVKAVSKNDISVKIENLQSELKAAKKALEAAAGAAVDAKLRDATGKSVDVGGLAFIRASFEGVSADTLRNSADSVKDKYPASVCLLSTITDGKVLLVACCGKDAVKSGAHAGMLLKAVSPILGGGGGGRPDSASSGGKDASKLPEAFAASEDILLKQLKK